MENSIEEDIEIIESIIEEYENCSVPEIDMQVNVTFREKQNNALNHILSDYKKVLKENEYMHNELDKQQTTINKYAKENEEYSKQLDLDYVDKNYISKQKIKDEIVELQKMNVDGEVFRTSVNFAIITFQKLLDKEN